MTHILHPFSTFILQGVQGLRGRGQHPVVPQAHPGSRPLRQSSKSAHVKVVPIFILRLPS